MHNIQYSCIGSSSRRKTESPLGHTKATLDVRLSQKFTPTSAPAFRNKTTKNSMLDSLNIVFLPPITLDFLKQRNALNDGR